MKNQFFQMTFKEVEVKAGKVKIKGLASTPQVDRYNDIVKPEAFMNAMATYMLNPIVLLQHDSCKPIGKVTSHQITADGLEVEAEISNDIDNCMKLITDKILRGFSIGFMVKKWEFQAGNTADTLSEIRVITELDLVEISVVSTPANPGSIFTLAKSVREYFLTQKSDEATTTEGIKEEIIESVQPESQKTEEVPAQEAQPTETQPATVETAGEIPAPAPTETVPVEAPKAETPSEVEILTSEVNALKTKLEELTTINASIQEENDKLKSDNAAKDVSIQELSTKTVSLEEKMSKVGVRRATIVTGTDNVRSFKTITYRDLIK
jgi:HK97 family phage prohead protease